MSQDVDTAMSPPHVQYMEFFPFPDCGTDYPYCKLCDQWGFGTHCDGKKHRKRLGAAAYWLSVWARHAEDRRARFLGVARTPAPVPAVVPPTSQPPPQVVPPTSQPAASQPAEPPHPEQANAARWALEVHRISSMRLSGGSTAGDWAVLDVERNADKSVIASKYRAQCKLLHPDKRPPREVMERLLVTEDMATIAFQRVRSAYDRVNPFTGVYTPTYAPFNGCPHAPFLHVARPAPVPPPQSPGCTSQPATSSRSPQPETSSRSPQQSGSTPAASQVRSVWISGPPGPPPEPSGGPRAPELRADPTRPGCFKHKDSAHTDCMHCIFTQCIFRSPKAQAARRQSSACCTSQPAASASQPEPAVAAPPPGAAAAKPPNSLARGKAPPPPTSRSPSEADRIAVMMPPDLRFPEDEGFQFRQTMEVD